MKTIKTITSVISVTEQDQYALKCFREMKCENCDHFKRDKAMPTEGYCREICDQLGIGRFDGGVNTEWFCGQFRKKRVAESTPNERLKRQ